MSISYLTKNIKKRAAPHLALENLKRIRLLQKSSIHEYHEMLDVLKVPFDDGVLREASLCAKELNTTSLRYVFVIGIGGSSLGSKAITSALPRRTGQPEIIFLESIDSRSLTKFEEIARSICSADEFVVNVISKAGGTTETIANFGFFLTGLSHITDLHSRVVVTTTKESALYEIAINEGYRTLILPQVISGRFSVFTVVGLFPLLLAGYPVTSLLDGAKEAGDLIGTPLDPTVKLVEDILSSLHDHIAILDFFVFNIELEDLGKWGRQLYAESLGKELDKTGKIVNTGITPTVTIGSTDLHSMVQLYFAGPKNRMTLFVPPLSGKLHVVPAYSFTPLVPGLAGKTSHEVNRAIYGGVFSAYEQHGMPFVEARFSALNAEMLGFYMQWQMQVVATLAAALHIDGFNQPNVEDYKKITKNLLTQKL